MSWQEIIGHERVVRQLQRAIVRRRLTGSYLFVGPPGVGKRTVAWKVAQTLLCSARASDSPHPCGHCPSCRLVQSGNHPDFEVIRRPEDRSNLPIELFVGDREHRNQEGLCHRIALAPVHSGHRVAIIDDADDLSIEAANVLLKTLEEPPPYAVLILLATSLARQLPTVRSRCQVVSFQPLEPDQLRQVLSRCTPADTTIPLDTLVCLGQGSVQNALEWADEDLLALRRTLLNELATAAWDPFSTARQLQQYVDRVGKHNVDKRRTLRLIIQAAVDFYRAIACLMQGTQPNVDADLAHAARQAVTSRRFDWKLISVCLDACVQAEQALMANAHLPTLIDAWLDQLAEGYLTGVESVAWP